MVEKKMSRGVGKKIRTHPLLGKVPDAEVGLMLGCSSQTVSYHRRLLGIPSCGQAGRNTKYHALKNHPLIGRLPDRYVAEMVGCSWSTVTKERRRLGIKASGIRGYSAVNDVLERYKNGASPTGD